MQYIWIPFFKSKKKGPAFGTLVSYNFLSVYKNPLSLFKIKKGIKKEEEVVVYSIHFFAFLLYKSS